MKGFELFNRKKESKRGLYSSMHCSGAINVGGSKWHELGKAEWCTLSFNPETQQILVKPATRYDEGARAINWQGHTNYIIPGGNYFAACYNLLPEKPRYYSHEIVVDDDGLQCVLLTPLPATTEYWPNRRGVDAINGEVEHAAN